jgi:hypothetical protein
VQIEGASDSSMASVNGAAAIVSLDSRIEIEIGNATVYVPAGADVDTLRDVLAALRFGR